MSQGRGVSCGFLGERAGELAAQALRRRRGRDERSLLVRWGQPAPKRTWTGVQPAVRRTAATLRSELPSAWVIGVHGRVITVDVPGGAEESESVRALVAEFGGSVAVVAGVPRCDRVDGVLRMLDELVLVRPESEALRVLVHDELRPLSRSVSVVDPPQGRWAALLGGGGEQGQSTVVMLAVVAVVMAVALGLGLTASALGRSSGTQGRVDVAALAAAAAMRAAQPLLYSSDPDQLIDPAEYRRRALAAARASGEANDLQVRAVELLGDHNLPTRVRVIALSAGANQDASDTVVRGTAEVVVAGLGELASGGGYSGALEVRQGQRMRPDVALAFDRMNAAATAAGVPLAITSAFRSDAEQAELFRRHPDPKWVARPGTSLHRLGTELDLGPNAAWPWLAANAKRFGFLQRYAWEAWHFGYVRSPGTTSVGYTPGGSGADQSAADDDGTPAQSTKAGGSGEASGSAVPAFVPAKYAGLIAAAAQRWSVGAALLGAQLKTESQFNPAAVSPVGAAGLAQFMPATGLAYGLSPAERFDPAKAINAQAHLMHDLLRQFGSVPLALAAYNAGPAAVTRCMCVPPYPETQGYVQEILALLGGAGLAAPAGLQIRLVA